MIFNVGSTGGNNSEEIAAMLTQFMSEVNSQLTALSSDMSTKIAAVTTNVNSKFSTLTSTVNSKATVKSVQRGNVTPTVDGDTVISINTVNPSKCLVLVFASMIDGADVTYVAVPYTLTSTTLTVSRSRYRYGEKTMFIPFSWQVIEFY